MMRHWWQAFRDWLADGDVSLAVIPLSSDLISDTRRLRKGLRDVRDRAARHDQRWKQVAFGGLADGDRALILIQHNNIDRDKVWETLEHRWPDITLCDWDSIKPSSRMTGDHAAALARRKRGIEPLRIIVMPQVIASSAGWDEAMPFVF